MPSSVPCRHLSARSYWQHLLCAHFLQSPHTLSSFLGPTTGLGRANTLRSGTSNNTGTQSLNWRRRLLPQDPPKGPLQIIISIADQQLSLYDNGALIARSSVSTGVQGHPTPLGVFSVISKERWHRSNIYSGAPMPYMQRITWSGIALHAGVVPGHPASHGCIRLTNDFAIRLWHLAKRGTRVIIASDDVRPVEIANSHLFVSKPKAASVSPESSAVTVTDNDNKTAPSHGALLSSAETPEVANLQIPGSIPQERRLKRSCPSLSS